MNSINFEYPYVLFLLPVIFFCLKKCPQSQDSILFSNIKFLHQISKTLSLLDIFKFLSIVFFILALSSPYKTKNYIKNIKISSSQVLAIDISESMRDSFKSVKDILEKYIQNQTSSLLSLVYFGNSVAISSPLSEDREFLKKSLNSIKAGDLGEMDTKLYDAILLSKDILKDSKTKQKSIIVLTDGIDKGSQTSLNELLSLLDKNITINTVGFGEDFDEDILKSIAKKAGGIFTKAQNISELKKFFLKDKNKEIVKNKNYTKKVLLYQLPLFFSFLSLLFYIYFLNKRAVV